MPPALLATVIVDFSAAVVVRALAIPVSTAAVEPTVNPPSLSVVTPVVRSAVDEIVAEPSVKAIFSPD